MKLLAIDLGASSEKTYLGNFDGKNLEISEIDRFSHNPVFVNGELFWNALGIFEHISNGINEAIQSEKIASIGFDSFSNDFGLIDKDGRFLTQVHCYRDERTKRNASKIYSMMPRKKLHYLSGNQIALFGTLLQLGSMCLEQQAFLLEGAGHLLFLPDLYIYFLTGEIGSEYTISSVSQMYSYEQRGWCDEIISSFAIPRRIFPDIIMPGTRVGSIKNISGKTNGKIKTEIIAVCEHDTASAFLAAPLGKDSIIISSGTWSLVGVELPKPIINDFTFEHNIANEGGYTEHHRLLKNVMGLWIIQECQRYFENRGTIFSIEDILDMAATAKPLQMFINPNDELFYSPGNMPEKIVTYCRNHGEIIPETPDEIFRCVFESLAMHYRYVINELEDVSGKDYPSINIVGGGSKNTLLNQFTANATNRNVYAGPVEATAIGNMIVQLISLKEISNLEEARNMIRQSFKVKEFEPENSDLWNEEYGGYIKMIRS